MPDGTTERRFPRYPIQLPFVYTVRAGGSPTGGAGWTRTLSEGGASVETAERLRPQTPLGLRLLTDRGTVELEARVIWLGKPAPPGGGLIHGVAFTQIALADVQTLRELFRPLVLTRQSGLRLALDLPVTCQMADPAAPPLQGRTQNGSRGGLRLRLPQLLVPGTPLVVTLHAPGGPLMVEGAIAWVEPPEMWTPGESIGHGFRLAASDWTTVCALALLFLGPA
ncbi:MAG: PilZ domain-containing protein, partial [candidate division NC10 bacterium]|nr:PilZ domain-containing protein [candidate division NC10 bacterium]